MYFAIKFLQLEEELKVRKLFDEVNPTIKAFKMFKFHDFFTFIDGKIDLLK